MIATGSVFQARGPRTPGRRGSIMIIVLVTIAMAAAMLTLFIDKAGTDLAIEARHGQTRALRREAYSALEVTLAVLTNWVTAQNNILRSPNEGWGDPLGFAGWTPPDGLEITVAFEDESGRISLPAVDVATLNAVFESWEMTQEEAQELSDALLSWMRPNYTSTSTFSASYDQGELPYAVPARSLLSYDELAAIDVASTKFYGEDGLPNALWWKFRDTFSLFNYTQPNLNALPARPEVLVAMSGFEETAVEKLNAYLTGTGEFEGSGPRFFRNVNEVGAILGTGRTNAVGIQIRALRVIVTVREGLTQYVLESVVQLPNGAQTVQSTATNNPTVASDPTAANQATNAAGRGGAGGAAGGTGAGAARGGTGRGAAGAGRGGAAGAAGTAATSIQYPFTILAIRENLIPNSSLSAPPPPVEEPAEP